MAVDGDTVLVGAVGDDGDRGSAYVFGTGEWADIAGSGAGTISHIAKGLRNNVKHTFRVRAVNAAGESDPPTDEKSATPVAATSAPAAPANFSATQTGVGQVELTWDAHLDSLSVTGYEYNVDAGGGPSWNPIPDSDSSTVSHAINDLTVGSPPTQYAFAVRAVNTAFNKDSNSAALTASGSKSLTLVAQPAAAGGLAAVAGDEQVKLTWNDPVAGSPPIAKYQLLQLDPSKLTASDGLRGDEFGISVAVDGDTAVIGAYLDDTTNGDNSGSAYVFTKVSGVWRQAAKLTASDGAANDEFGYSVAVDGDTIVVGAHQDDADDQDNNEGAAYVFTEPALGWGDWSTLDTDGKAALTVKLTAYQGAANDEFGISVAVNGNTILVGAHQHDADASDNNEGAAYRGTLTASSSGWGNAPASGGCHRDRDRQAHRPSDATAGDEFGISVAVDGDTAVDRGVPRRPITDDGDTIGRSNAGSAYVFTKELSGVWSWSAKLTASDAAENDEFGISVAVDGDTIVVGAHQNDSNKGAAYVFTWNSSNSKWEQKAKLTASDAAANDEFGIFVAVHGETVVVGAHQNDADDQDTNEGAAYVFTKTGGAWTSTTTAAKLTASDGEANDEFGVSVAVDEDTVAVGAHLHDLDVDGASMLDAGAVYVFTKPAAGWTSSTESAKLTATDGAAGDEFGISVAIDGDTVVTGAYRDDSMATDSDDGLDSGSVYVFDRDPESGKWSQTAKLTASNGDGGDRFGNSVAVDGDTAVVGAYLDDNPGIVLTDSGSVYVFTNQSGVWSEALNLAAPDAATDDHFGRSVAVAGGIVLAGVPQVDEDRPDAGSAYVMDISNAMWEDLKAEELTVSYEVKDLPVEEDYFYRVLDLTNDQEYAFRVRSVNAAGNHPSAETVSATPKLGRPVKPTGLVAEARDRAVELSWDLSDDSTIKHYQVLQHPEQSRFTASDGAGGDQFGSAVAVDGGTAVVGAPQDDDNGDNSGSAYVFTRHPLSGGWSRPIKLTAFDGKENDWFGYSVAVHGDTIVVGAYQHDLDSESDAGAAYVFTRPDGGWVATSTADKLTASDGVEGDRFGYSVAVHEDTVVVGARGDDGKKGASYVFTKPAGGDWTSTSTSSKLTASDGVAVDYFGHSVAVHGDIILVGAFRHDLTGAAYVFTRPGGGWVATSTAAKLTASDGKHDDQFGRSVAVDGDTVVIGAQQDDGLRGSAYVFTDAIETAKLTASDRDANDYFGSSVAVRGGTIVVGAYAANVDVCDPDESDDDDCDEDPRSGAAYLFTKPAGAVWANDPNEDYRTESDKLILPTDEEERGDEFGNSVALDGQSIVVGAPEGNDGFGSVHVSDIPQWAHIDDSKATTVSHRVTDLENGVEYTFQVRAVDKVSDVGESPPSNIARATPLVRNHAPEFDLGESATLAVDEEEPPGNHVGSAVTATDPEGNTLAYSLSATHASSFDIDASNGQIAVGSGTTLDYESGLREYSVIVSVHDRLDTDGDQDTTNDDSINVTINVNNVDEAGTVSMSTRPREGTTLSASLTDPDGSVSDTSWQWARSANGSTGWRDIVRANSYRYRPVANDGGNYLRATASYTDGHGSGKEAAVVSTNRVRSLDRPETSPPPTPTPVPITVVPPGVGDATVPPGLLLVIGLMGMLLVIAGSIMVRERRSNRRL